MNRRAGMLLLIAFAYPANAARAASDEGVAFFEKRIRPVLVKHCYACHSAVAKKLKGGLRLDSRAGVLTGGDTGAAVIPGKPAESLILQALRHDGLEMPPSGKLPAQVITDFERWVKIGAPDPRKGPANAAEEFDLRGRAKEHWSWRPPRMPALSKDGNASPIDELIDRRLREEGLQPSPPASRRQLIRRLKYDLVGLPPTGGEISRFLADKSPRAYESLVDQWLNSPRFGEKWASHWLDVIRFSETKGHVTDQERPYAWKYRDYVIDALNDDLPYDRFVIEHLAGDLLPADEQRAGKNGQSNVAPTATGALFMHEMHFMAVDPVKQRWDEIDAQVDTIGQAFLGLTLGCARCHDHKFDAISQRDYYALAGFFYSTEQGTARTGPRASLPAADEDRVARLEQEYDRFLQSKIAQRRKAQSPKTKGYFPISEELGIQSPNDFRTQMRKIKTIEALDPSWALWVRAAKDATGKDVAISIRGDHENPGKIVRRRFLEALSLEQSGPDLGGGSGRRWLSRQIASADNPLTARVWVNRLWHHSFGRGIVATPNNFGKLGAPPSHPELLDYLALRLIKSKWSTKAVLREIVLSRAYRRSGKPVGDASRRDPDNRWLARQNVRRLSAEQLRDSVLFVSGALDLSMHGPSVSFFVPAYATANKASNVPSSGPLDGAGRRSVYLKVRRNFQAPMLAVFDFPDRGKSIGRRHVTTVPAQALAMMNGPFVHDQASRWAAKSLSSSDSPRRRVAVMFEQATGRPPDSTEQLALRELAKNLRASHKKAGLPDKQLWTDLAHVLFNLNEFSTIE